MQGMVYQFTSCNTRPFWHQASRLSRPRGCNQEKDSRPFFLVPGDKSTCNT